MADSGVGDTLGTMGETFGATDCERIGEAFLSQPVNSLTSLAFVVAGLEIARRRPDRRIFGIAVAMVGIGSFVAHGPRWDGSVWLHDVTIAWVLVLVLAAGMPRVVAGGAIPGLGVLFAVTPVTNDAVLVVLAIGAIGREFLPSRRTVATVVAVAILATGSVIGTLSRTGWPLCEPDSLLQGHALWHVLAATALAVWGLRSRVGEQAEVMAP
jgi:hypothetical protein